MTDILKCHSELRQNKIRMTYDLRKKLELDRERIDFEDAFVLNIEDSAKNKNK